MIPIRYVEPVFRPPSEAESLILPVTDGCSWNKCTYCEMYTEPQKKFRVREENEIFDSIRRTADMYGKYIRRVFLADGDALVLPTRRLLLILEAIRCLTGTLRLHTFQTKCARAIRRAEGTERALCRRRVILALSFSSDVNADFASALYFLRPERRSSKRKRLMKSRYRARAPNTAAFRSSSVPSIPAACIRLIFWAS